MHQSKDLSTNLVRMLNVNAEAELLQQSPFRFDHLIFQVHIVDIQYYRFDEPRKMA